MFTQWNITQSLKNNEIVKFIGKCRELEKIVLSKIS